jgi:hypothetical protein
VFEYLPCFKCLLSSSGARLATELASLVCLVVTFSEWPYIEFLKHPVDSGRNGELGVTSENVNITDFKVIYGYFASAVGMLSLGSH